MRLSPRVGGLGPWVSLRLSPRFLSWLLFRLRSGCCHSNRDVELSNLAIVLAPALKLPVSQVLGSKFASSLSSGFDDEGFLTTSSYMAPWVVIPGKGVRNTRNVVESFSIDLPAIASSLVLSHSELHCLTDLDRDSICLKVCLCLLIALSEVIGLNRRDSGGDVSSMSTRLCPRVSLWCRLLP